MTVMMMTMMTMTMMTMTVMMMTMTMMVSAADEGTMKGTRWTPVGINQPCHDSLNLNAAGQQWWEVYGCTYHRNNSSQSIRNTKVLKHLRAKTKFIFGFPVATFPVPYSYKSTKEEELPYKPYLFWDQMSLFLSIWCFVKHFNQFFNWRQNQLSHTFKLDNHLIHKRGTFKTGPAPPDF